MFYISMVIITVRIKTLRSVEEVVWIDVFVSYVGWIVTFLSSAQMLSVIFNISECLFELNRTLV